MPNYFGASRLPQRQKTFVRITFVQVSTCWARQRSVKHLSRSTVDCISWRSNYQPSAPCRVYCLSPDVRNLSGSTNERILPMDVSEVRRRLNIAPTAGSAWFSVDEKEVAFAPHKTPGHRAVILRDWPENGPLAWVFARSKTSSSGLSHLPHQHKAEYPHCWLAQRAKIVTALPLTIKKSALDHSTAMCEESDQAITFAVMSVKVPV